MTGNKVFLLPIVQLVVFLFTFILTYVLAALVNKDVPAIFPYISDTGVWSVERCIFTFMLGIGALLMFATLYIRCQHVTEVIKTFDQETQTKYSKVRLLNSITLYLTVISVIGVFGLACFQVYPYLVMHFASVTIAFVPGTLIFVLQTYISYRLYPAIGFKWLNHLRVAILVIMNLSLTLTGIFLILSIIHFKGDIITQWTEESGGYKYHLVSVAFEWVFVPSVNIFISLYAVEFRTLVIHKPKIEINSKTSMY